MFDRHGALTLATCQAANTVPISRALAKYLSVRVGILVKFLDTIPWQDAYQGIASGEIDLGWICGWPYTQLVDESSAPIQLLAAPVMKARRYGDRPVYFSDVLVRRDSGFNSFMDLRGASWAYNEPGSQSGYHITRYHLARLGVGDAFFGRVIESGSHASSLAMILNGEVDAAAVDSTVLEWEIEHDTNLAQRLRVIDSLGPSSIPPLVVSTALNEQLVQALRRLLLAMHITQDGTELLSLGRLLRFTAVTDMDYDDIRQMGVAARNISL